LKTRAKIEQERIGLLIDAIARLESAEEKSAGESLDSGENHPRLKSSDID